MERSEWDDDDYPAAPVPRHERQWRHPSEMGAAHWERTEPPLALGRGLLATTGIIGTLLAVGVLWVMLPSGPDDEVATEATTPSDATTVVTGSIPRATFVSPSTIATTSTRPSSSVPAATTPAAPVPTVALRREAAPIQAVAAVVASGSLVVTTARALDRDGEFAEQLDIQLADGTTTSASVLLVDSRSGLAVLTLPDGAASGGYTMAATPKPGERLTILSDVPRSFVMPGGKDPGPQSESLRLDPRSADPGTAATSTSVAPVPTTTVRSTTTVPGNGGTAPATTSTTTTSTSTPTTQAPSTTSGTTTTTPTRSAIVLGELEGIDPNAIAEGTPVVNEGGELVGVCSHDDVTHTLLLVRLDALLRAGGQVAPHGWLGIHAGSGAAPLTITAVDPDGPAARAGLAVGDRIVAFAGRPVSTADELATAIAATRPGDKVTVTIAGTRAGPPQRTVTVTMADRPAQL